jgi:hypothetical protein
VLKVALPGRGLSAATGLGERDHNRELLIDYEQEQDENGGKGIRTPGLLIANETLYQLSYTPAKAIRTVAWTKQFSSNR